MEKWLTPAVRAALAALLVAAATVLAPEAVLRACALGEPLPVQLVVPPALGLSGSKL